MLRLADPPIRGNSPEMGAPPSKNVTVPVDEFGATFAAKVRESPATDGLFPAVKLTVTLALAFSTVCTSAGLADGLNWLFPVYRTLMECGPSPSAVVLNDADPLFTGMLPEIGVSPSMNCTAPLAVPGVTLAVKTSVSPSTEGLAPLLNATATLLFEVRNSTAVSRGFWNMNGQSFFEASYGACVFSTVTMPGIDVPSPPESWYATAMSVVPS